MLFPIFSWPFPYLQIYKQSLGHCLTKGIQLVRKQKLSATTLGLGFKMGNLELGDAIKTQCVGGAWVKSIHFFYSLPRIEFSRSEGRSVKRRQEELTKQWAQKTQFPSFWEGPPRRDGFSMNLGILVNYVLKITL